MKRVTMFAVMIVCATAFAGKEEREFMNKEVQPAARSAEAKWKSSCGCALTVAVDEASFKVKDDMYSAKHFCERVAEEITGYCTDDASKKAMCQMKKLVVKKDKDATFEFKGGTGTATVYGSTSPSWDMVTRQLDK
jgi:hypothetical protein